MVERIQRWLISILDGERGQDMVEYALITVVISVTIVLAALVADIPGAFNAWATDLGSCVADWATC